MKQVENSIQIMLSPSKVLQAFTEFDLLKGWWGVERCQVEKVAGGAYALAWGISDTGIHYVSCGVVAKYDPERSLEVEHMCYFNPAKEILTGMSMRVSVEPAQQGTLLTILQDGYRTGGDWDWYYDAVRLAWPEALKHLKQYLEGQSY